MWPPCMPLIACLGFSLPRSDLSCPTTAIPQPSPHPLTSRPAGTWFLRRTLTQPSPPHPPLPCRDVVPHNGKFLWLYKRNGQRVLCDPVSEWGALGGGWAAHLK